MSGEVARARTASRGACNAVICLERRPSVCRDERDLRYEDAVSGARAFRHDILAWREGAPLVTICCSFFVSAFEIENKRFGHQSPFRGLLCTAIATIGTSRGSNASATSTEEPR